MMFFYIVAMGWILISAYVRIPSINKPLLPSAIVLYSSCCIVNGIHHGEPGSALSGGYTPGSASLESSSIVDEPGEC